MSDEFKVGDVVVRVNDPKAIMRVGTIAKVLDLWWWEGDSEVPACLALELDIKPPNDLSDSWVAHNFKHLPKADDTFINQMRSLKQPRRRPMFDNPYFYIAVVIALCFAAVVYLAWTAPVGHEDEHGYHSDLEDEA